MIAQIAVSAAVFAIDKPYDYRIPEGMPLVPGLRVCVPFGRANKPTEGVVLALAEGSEEKLKPVAETLDDAPVLSERELHLAAFLRERYFCTFFDAIKAILPAGVWFREKCRYTVVPGTDWRHAAAHSPSAASISSTTHCMTALRRLVCA